MQKFRDLEKQLKELAGEADVLILWLDCDREGEAIGFEVKDICLSAKRNLPVKRARFSAVTRGAAMDALSRLQIPNQCEADAVEARTEFDLRIGAAYTRFQTLRLRQKFSEESISRFSKGDKETSVAHAFFRYFKNRATTFVTHICTSMLRLNPNVFTGCELRSVPISDSRIRGQKAS